MRSFLLPRRSFLRGSPTRTWATRGCSSPTSHWAEVPSSNATCRWPRNSSSSSSTAAALVGMTRSNINFPRLSQTATEMVSRCTSRPTYLLPLSMRVLLVVESCGLIHRQLTPQGRPFIMRRDIGKSESQKRRVTVDFEGLLFPLDPHIFCDYNIPVRILMCDKQAVSGVPELHWRQYEHHFVQRRAAPERPP